MANDVPLGFPSPEPHSLPIFPKTDPRDIVSTHDTVLGVQTVGQVGSDVGGGQVGSQDVLADTEPEHQRRNRNRGGLPGFLKNLACW